MHICIFTYVYRKLFGHININVYEWKRSWMSRGAKAQKKDNRT